MAREETTASEVRQNALSEMVLWQAEELAFPPTQWEADTLAEVLALPRVTVTRPPEEKLLAAGMVRNHCHVNCSSQAADYPALIRHVSGWLISGHMLVLHSVIEVRGQWRCVTPQMVSSPSRFQFIPDPSIVRLEADDGKGMDPFRQGVKLPNGLRKYPQHHVRMRDELRALIASGMTALDAREIVDATLGAELRSKVPILTAGTPLDVDPGNGSSKR